MNQIAHNCVEKPLEMHFKLNRGIEKSEEKRKKVYKPPHLALDLS